MLRIATRKSPLALWQAGYVKQCLEKLQPGLLVELLPLTTAGDRLLGSPLAKIGGKGLFVKELEQALIDKKADLAVHSMKDVPVNFPPGLILTSICKREDPRDAFVSSHYNDLSELPLGAIIGTASLRRQCLVKSLRPDLEVVSLRGNVNTRLQRLDDREFSGILLATAGLMRLDLTHRIRSYLPVEQFVPAVGQGALGIECRENDVHLRELLQALNHLPTYHCVMAERAMNEALQGGCQVPIGCHAILNDTEITMVGIVGRPDGTLVLRDSIKGDVNSAELLGEGLAQRLLAQGARGILDEVYQLS